MVEPANHLQRERALALHDLVDAAAASDHSDQRAQVESLLFKPKANRCDWVGRVDGKVLLLLGFDQRREHVEAIAVRGPLFGAP
jgi:hypothetical protein